MQELYVSPHKNPKSQIQPDQSYPHILAARRETSLPPRGKSSGLLLPLFLQYQQTNSRSFLAFDSDIGIRCAGTAIFDIEGDWSGGKGASG
jgi:hypothetical protein